MGQAGLKTGATLAFMKGYSLLFNCYPLVLGPPTPPEADLEPEFGGMGVCVVDKGHIGKVGNMIQEKEKINEDQVIKSLPWWATECYFQ